jgi:hypothetical protein
MCMHLQLCRSEGRAVTKEHTLCMYAAYMIKALCSLRRFMCRQGNRNAASTVFFTAACLCTAYFESSSLECSGALLIF